jgi:hypothetical protein
VLDLHVVSDHRIGFRDMVATVHLSWSQHGDEKRLEWRWSGDVEPDSCVRIGTLDTLVPPADGEVVVGLELRDAHGHLEADNHYELAVG